MSRTLIGTAVTDANGRCSITYTGTGAGKLQLVAKQGNFESNTIELMDYLFFSKDITDWINISNRISATRSGRQITLSNSNSSNGFFLANKTGTTSGNYTNAEDWETGITIECDIISYNGGIRFLLMDYSNNVDNGYDFSGLGITSNSHLKIVVANDGTAQYTVDDGTPKNRANVLIDTFYVGFRVPTDATLSFENFKIYRS